MFGGFYLDTGGKGEGKVRKGMIRGGYRLFNPFPFWMTKKGYRRAIRGVRLGDLGTWWKEISGAQEDD